MVEVGAVVLGVVGVAAFVFKLVRDPEPPPPAVLEGGRSHMRQVDD
jgi:hypothetical protein